MRNRYFGGFLVCVSCIVAACAGIVSISVGLISRLIEAATPNITPGHAHLLTGTPRSIFETRRMGLA